MLGEIVVCIHDASMYNKQWVMSKLSIQYWIQSIELITIASIVNNANNIVNHQVWLTLTIVASCQSMFIVIARKTNASVNLLAYVNNNLSP